MSDEEYIGEGENGPGGELGVPRKPRLPVVSLALTVVFLAAGVILLYLVRVELAYFFSSSGPEFKFRPVRDRPVPLDARSNVYAEARIDHRELCDAWDPTMETWTGDTYAFTLKMGLGGHYYLTCVGDGSIRPRLWILKPESPEESKRIHHEAMREVYAQPMLDRVAGGPVPEIHVPGGDACVNDLCRGRLVRFSEYSGNIFAGVGDLRETLETRLLMETERTRMSPLLEDDYLFILGETPRGNWWYVALLGLVVVLSALNLVLGARFVSRWVQARRRASSYMEQARRLAGG